MAVAGTAGGFKSNGLRPRPPPAVSGSIEVRWGGVLWGESFGDVLWGSPLGESFGGVLWGSPLGTISCHFGFIWGHLGVILNSYWGNFGTGGEHVGPVEGHLGALGVIFFGGGL